MCTRMSQCNQSHGSDELGGLGGRAPQKARKLPRMVFRGALPECNCNSFGSIADIELLNDLVDVVSGGIFILGDTHPLFHKNKAAALASNTQPKTRKQSLYASVGHHFAGRGDRFWKTIPPRWFYVGTDCLRIVERTDAGHSQGGIRVMNVARIMRPTLAAERTATVGADEVRRAIVPRSHYDRIF